MDGDPPLPRHHLIGNAHDEQADPADKLALAWTWNSAGEISRAVADCQAPWNVMALNSIAPSSQPMVRPTTKLALM